MGIFGSPKCSTGDGKPATVSFGNLNLCRSCGTIQKAAGDKTDAQADRIPGTGVKKTR